MRQLSHAARDWLRKVRKAVRRFLGIDRATELLMRLPGVILVGAVCRAPAGRRRKFLRCARQSLSLRLAPWPAEHCEITSLTDFETNYAHLASLLERPGKTPAAGEAESLASIAKRRRDYQGAIGAADLFFLTAFISILAPQRVIEIGTLTGFSAGVIASALTQRQGAVGTSWVDTIDIRTQCAIDATRRSGFEIGELFPDVASMIRVHMPRDASFVSQLAARDELEVAFIDADHRHPLVLLDLLRLAPYMRPDGWIILHDIQLGTLTREAMNAGRKTPFEPVYGVEWLFSRWPFRKISGGNIGAVQLPQEKSALIPFVLRMMSVPFETPQKQARATRRALYQSVGALC
jgi:predicted O-methyltransferase YrrM